MYLRNFDFLTSCKSTCCTSLADLEGVSSALRCWSKPFRGFTLKTEEGQQHTFLALGQKTGQSINRERAGLVTGGHKWTSALDNNSDGKQHHKAGTGVSNRCSQTSRGKSYLAPRRITHDSEMRVGLGYRLAQANFARVAQGILSQSSLQSAFPVFLSFINYPPRSLCSTKCTLSTPL